MFSHTIWFYILVLSFSTTVNTTKCFDCVLISSCGDALTAVTSLQNGNKHALYRIKNAICNFKGYDAKVCCSHFSEIDDPIQHHPNFALLPENCGKISNDPSIDIINGKVFEFPWMAFICHRTKEGLGFDHAGTIINSRYILTTAYYVYFREKFTVKVYIGEFNISTMDYSRTRKEMKVEKIIIHEEYNMSNPVASQNNIALVRLDTPIDFTQTQQQHYAAPICLPLSNNERKVILEDTIATVAGWRRIGSGAHYIRVQTVEILLKLKGSCLGYSPNIRNYFCVKNTEACHYRYGALMIKGTHKGAHRYIQYGIRSHGPNKCEKLSVRPEVYTDVTKFVQWILDNIEE